jgi:hypothetical protein
VSTKLRTSPALAAAVDVRAAVAVAAASAVTAAVVAAAAAVVATAGKLLSLIVMIKGPAQAGPFFIASR